MKNEEEKDRQFLKGKKKPILMVCTRLYLEATDVM